MKTARVIAALLLLTGCEKIDTSALDHPLVQALIAKVTGKQVEMPTMEEAAERLTEEQREELKARYKPQIDAYREKKARALSSEGEDSNPSIMDSSPSEE